VCCVFSVGLHGSTAPAVRRKLAGVVSENVTPAVYPLTRNYDADAVAIVTFSASSRWVDRYNDTDKLRRLHKAVLIHLRAGPKRPWQVIKYLCVKLLLA